MPLAILIQKEKEVTTISHLNQGNWEVTKATLSKKASEITLIWSEN